MVDQVEVRLIKTGETSSSYITQNPRKFIIKSGFGTLPRRCWVEFFNEDVHIPAALGDTLEIVLNQYDCFKGPIVERRIDSIDDILTLYAQWKPEDRFNLPISGLFQNMRPTDILNHILSDSLLVRNDDFSSSSTYNSLEFSNYPLFSAIDLLAKLSGNWYWDIVENNQLSFRPSQSYPDHEIFLPLDQYTVNIWESIREHPAYVHIHAGIIDGWDYENWLEIPNPMDQPNHIIKIFVRPLTSYDAICAIQREIQNQLQHSLYEHYMDMVGFGEQILPGETVRFRIDDLPLFPQEQIFRVKMREIVYAHEQYHVRLHLTTGYESSEDYFEYFRHDSIVTPSYLEGRVGVFQLDVSALDSPVFLDSA